MKMQNILKAERDGVVKAVGASAGDPVAADDVLVEFEKVCLTKLRRGTHAAERPAVRL